MQINDHIRDLFPPEQNKTSIIIDCFILIPLELIKLCEAIRTLLTFECLKSFTKQSRTFCVIIFSFTSYEHFSENAQSNVVREQSSTGTSGTREKINRHNNDACVGGGEGKRRRNNTTQHSHTSILPQHKIL